ncbi:MAG: MFS transporter [Dehalococcoidia bacterium]|nr:MFS transporter [Dehalococcoidia bacterium]
MNSGNLGVPRPRGGPGGMAAGGHGGMGQGSLVLTRTMFASLANRDFLLVWLSNLAAMFGMQMQMVARGWLIYDMTTSAVALAWVTFSFMMPTLIFSLLGGVIADRLRKKRVMIFAQVMHFIAMLVIATITITGNVTFTYFIFFGLLNGTLMSLNAPARQAIVPGIVGESGLGNAVALNMASMNLSRILAPTIAGVLIALLAGGDKTSALGVGIVFYVIAVLDLLSVVVLLLLRYEGRDVRVERRGMVSDMGDGLKYVKSSPLIMGLLVMGFVPMLFGMPLMFLLPVFNKEVLKMGPEGLGLLMTAMGAGALIGSLALAGAGNVGRKGLILLASAMVWALFMGLFALSGNLSMSLLLLAMVGLSSTAYMAMNMTLIQLAVPARMMGRVMSLAMMTFGLMPLGVFPMSIVAESYGIGTAFLAGAVGLGIATITCAIVFQSIRRIDKGHEPLAEPVSSNDYPGDPVSAQTDMAAKK